ncbi:hypothetical protein F5141DRAFT_1080891 [Pisolithus sp. B1]|nr:hypothetical protein F5141DRAFT_1080891 [Pisolithus sp. B1]
MPSKRVPVPEYPRNIVSSSLWISFDRWGVLIHIVILLTNADDGDERKPLFKFKMQSSQADLISAWLNDQHQLGPEVARLAQVSLSDMVGWHRPIRLYVTWFLPVQGLLFFLALLVTRTEGHI